MAAFINKIEFDLKIRKFAEKDSGNDFGRINGNDPIELVEYEKLEFHSISAKEVLRKLIDYLKD